MSIDLERDLFRKLPADLSSRIERSVYNRRKRGLFYCREQIRKQLANSSDPNKLIDALLRFMGRR